MDLYAYANIGLLERIAKNNSIDVPRLRGYRLMSYEEIMTKEVIDGAAEYMAIVTAKNLCQAVPFWSPNPHYHMYSDQISRLCKYYLETNENHDYCGIRWDRIHGKKRKILKFEIKKNKRAVIKQLETFNKYVGREDVLMIHARIGGNNWEYFEGPTKIANQPWFLEKVDDHFDRTYCDIYAKVTRVPGDVVYEEMEE